MAAASNAGVVAYYTPFHHHDVSLATGGGDWACDARHFPRGCRKGRGQNDGRRRFSCIEGCNYNLCEDCVRMTAEGGLRATPVPAAEAPPIVINSSRGLFSSALAMFANFAGPMSTQYSAGGGHDPFGGSQGFGGGYGYGRPPGAGGYSSHVVQSSSVTTHTVSQTSGTRPPAGSARPPSSSTPVVAPASQPGTARPPQASSTAPISPAPAPVPVPAPNTAGPAASVPAPGATRPPRKRALIIGINYIGSAAPLKGCVNDARCMQTLLIRRFGFKEADMKLVIEDGPDRSTYPTKANIESGLRWLIEGVQPGDSLFLHYAGHGAQTKDVGDDEGDDQDEVLVPMDYTTAGLVYDDFINDTIVRPLPAGAKLHAVIDACHSGTMLDLPYLWNNDDKTQWTQENDPAKRGCKGLVVAISGCLDKETSADTNAFARTKTTGAMTFCFTLAVESGEATSYNDLMDAMRAMLAGQPSDVMRRALHEGSAQDVYAGKQTASTALATGSYVQANAGHPLPKFTQLPQLTCSQKIDHETPLQIA